MPLLWVFVLLLFSYFSKNAKWRKRSFWTAIVFLFLLSNEFLANEAMLAWEIPPTPMKDVKEYSIGVVLTGVTNYSKKPQDRVYFMKGADRIMHALHLYRLGKIKKILITGGKGTIGNYMIRPESVELKEVLKLAHVPEEDIYIETESINTHENATLTAGVLKNKGLEKEKLLLITSAFHMRRSEGCFKKAGLDTDEFSCDFYSGERIYTLDRFIVPSEVAISKWGLLAHEVIGYVVYKLVGYA